MINEQEINSILKQDENACLEYTIKRIADFENVWVIEEDDKYTT
ncbi:hypothetical protein [Chitinophaga silvisoli]|nr:hypothetical protein [Chitinophaga silvisoli]